MPDYNNDLDLTFLYEIADGSNEFIVESISMFIDQSPDIMRELGNAIAAGNWAQAAQEAHKIKANLGFFGMLNSYGATYNYTTKGSAIPFGSPITTAFIASFG